MLTFQHVKLFHRIRVSYMRSSVKGYSTWLSYSSCIDTSAVLSVLSRKRWSREEKTKRTTRTTAFTLAFARPTRRRTGAIMVGGRQE